MNSSKIKNLIINVLVVVNVVLLGVGLSDRVRENAVWRESLERTEQLLSENGIAMQDMSALKNAALPVRTVARDLEREKKNVSAVLGKVTVVDQGGNRLFYNGEKGQAVFRGTGGFEILMNEEAVPVGRDAEATARSFLRKLGIGTSADDVTCDVTDGSGTVILTGEVNGTQVLSCTVTLTFTNGSLLLAVGTRPLEPVAVGESSAVDLPTALIRFAAAANASGRVCSRVIDARLCCVQSASASGTGELTPVWRIDTDAGSFFINAMTGREETVA